ncbi:MAG TPA: ATPase, T2SS/T4P/T4SS family [Candidatus Acidoferrum sp.]|nr:ATPase, T2SS/T4P/T4SS family [Candidatus Acidoferrum sp.]
MRTFDEPENPRAFKVQRETLSRLTSSKVESSAVQVSPPAWPTGKPEPAADPVELSSSQQLLGHLLIKHRLITEAQLDEALEIQQTTRPYKPIGQILVERGAMAQSDLKAILDLYRKRSRLGETLVKSRVITAEQLAIALNEQKQLGLRLGETLMKLNYITEEVLRRALSSQLSIPFVDLNAYAIDSRLMKLINRNYAKKHLVVPVCMTGDTITLAMEDPTDTGIVEEIRSFTGCTITVVTSTYETLRRAFRRLYEEGATEEDAAPKLETINEVAHEPGLGEDTTETKQADAIVRDLVTVALEHRASDIHLEAVDYRLRARFRIDGELRELSLPALTESLSRSPRSVVSRIKILGNLDIAEKRRPQDGSFRVRIQRNGQIIPADCRISIVPGYYGENALIRILDQRNTKTEVRQLGFSPQVTDKLVELLKRPTGFVLITGPTGAGKSTTLFASLMTLWRPGVKVLTVEDPIEYVCEHFTQCEVNERIGNTFSTYLRAFLRHDPDVVMVGEIRDQQSAELTLRAAQTGHLVLSTLHTNNAVGSISRLLDMGLDRGVLTSALLGVVAQRLVRKICEHCRTEWTPSPSFVQELFGGPGPGIPWYRGKGCEKCHFTGFSGRMLVGELWVPNENDILLINKGAPFDEIVASSRASTVSMGEDVRERLRTGVANLEELVRTLPYSSLYKFREPDFMA